MHFDRRIVVLLILGAGESHDCCVAKSVWNVLRYQLPTASSSNTVHTARDGYARRLKFSVCTILKPDEDDHELWASCLPRDSSDSQELKSEVPVPDRSQFFVEVQNCQEF
jgi:hypothetical protein